MAVGLKRVDAKDVPESAKTDVEAEAEADAAGAPALWLWLGLELVLGPVGGE